MHSLLDCVRFSPALLTGGYTKPLFLIYQLLRLMRHLHDYGLALGDITLSDVLISDSLWIQVCILFYSFNNFVLNIDIV